MSLKATKPCRGGGRGWIKLPLNSVPSSPPGACDAFWGLASVPRPLEHMDNPPHPHPQKRKERKDINVKITSNPICYLPEITSLNISGSHLPDFFSMHIYAYITKMGSYHAYCYLFLPPSNILWALARTDRYTSLSQTVARYSSAGMTVPSFTELTSLDGQWGFQLFAPVSGAVINIPVHTSLHIWRICFWKWNCWLKWGSF